MSNAISVSKPEGRERPFWPAALAWCRTYAVLIAMAVLASVLTAMSDSFLTPTNLLNILNQNAPLAIMAIAMTLVIINGGFDLSVGSVFAVAGISAACVATVAGPQWGWLAAPLVGGLLGAGNGLVVTGLKIHSFLATLATSMVFRGVAMIVSGGALIPVRMPEFAWLGRGTIGGVYVAIIVMAAFFVLATVLLNRSTFGRWVVATGGNEKAAILAGIRTDRVKIMTFAFAGLAAGLAAAISVSRLSIGQPTAGVGLELQVIAAVILGGTSIYGGEGAIWRSLSGVFLLALINNGFNLLGTDPFYKDFATGIVILIAVALSIKTGRA